jgi:hypothetical protein
LPQAAVDMASAKPATTTFILVNRISSPVPGPVIPSLSGGA